jgi:biopolymer transport protein ExbD
MKKRSLIASIAMLLVSAIVLSTSTYAWFSAGATVSVAQVQATVQNTDGSIQIAATNGESTVWGQSVTLEELQAQTSTNHFSTALVPVSVDPTSGFSVVSGALEAGMNNGVAMNQLTVGTAATTSYTQYTVYIKANSAATVSLAPSFTGAVPFLYGGMLVDGTMYVYNSANHTYSPATSATSGSWDEDNNFIINGSEGTVGSAVTLQTDAVSSTFTAGQVKAVTFYIWAEGQDAACFGSVTPSAATMDFTAQKTA